VFHLPGRLCTHTTKNFRLCGSGGRREHRFTTSRVAARSPQRPLLVVPQPGRLMVQHRQQGQRWPHQRRKGGRECDRRARAGAPPLPLQRAGCAFAMPRAPPNRPAAQLRTHI